MSRPLIMNWEREELAGHLGADALEGKSQAELAVMWADYQASKTNPPFNPQAVSPDGQLLDALGWDRKTAKKAKISDH